MTTLALRLAYTDLDKLPTTPIDERIPAKSLKPRISDLPDLVTVNFRNKITMTTGQEKPEQAYFNPNCKIKPTEIPSKIELVFYDLDYSEVVNMQDVTGLDLGQAEPSISKPRQGKMVNFLDIFPDPENIDESKTWDACTVTDNVPKNMNLRTANPNDTKTTEDKNPY